MPLGRWRWVQLFNPFNWWGLAVGTLAALGGGYCMYRIYDYHWHTLMFQVQTVDFNLLTHTLPTKLSYDLLRGDRDELQRTLDSGYGFFGLVVTDATGRRILAMSRSQDAWTRHLQLDRHPYDLLLDPPPTKAQKFYQSFAAKEPTPYPVQPRGRVIGRVYYIRRVPHSFLQDLAIWLQNPLELRDARFPYTLTFISFLATGALLILVGNFFQLRAQQEKERILKERQQLADHLTELQEKLFQSQQELESLLGARQQLLDYYENQRLLGQENQQLRNTVTQLEQLIKQKEIEEQERQEKIREKLTRGGDSVGPLSSELLMRLHRADIIPHYDPSTNHLAHHTNLSPLRRIARFLGENFNQLRRIYSILKGACQTKDKLFSYVYQGNDNRQYINNFLSTLGRKGLLAELSPLAQARSVNGRLSDNPVLINFINGDWLEIYLYDFLIRHYRDYPLGDGWLKNLKYMSLDGQQGEIDLICIVNGRIAIVECKTGDYTEKVGKYQRLRNALSLSTEQFVMLVTEVDDQDLNALSQRYGLTFTTLNHFKSAFDRALGRPTN